MTIKQAMQLDRAAQVIHVYRDESNYRPCPPEKLKKIQSICDKKNIPFKRFDRAYSYNILECLSTPQDYEQLQKLSTNLEAEGVPKDQLDNEPIYNIQHDVKSCFHVRLTSGNWKKFDNMSDHKQRQALSKLLAPKTCCAKKVVLCIGYTPIVLGVALARSPM